MSKLLLNEDGSVTIPLMERPPITLAEPSLGQIGRMRQAAREADEALPVLATPAPGAPPEEIAAFNQALQERTDRIFGEFSPHGLALIAIIKELTGEDVDANHLPAWAGSPRTLGAILGHFQAPLPGPESE